jgi:2-oxoglutarate ferredoxin oxidoreductase subunit delta
MPVRGWIEVDVLYCKGCGLCVNACPKAVLALDMDRLTPKGYHPVHLIAEGCTGCAICSIICPDAAIMVYRETTRKEKQALTTA